MSAKRKSALPIIIAPSARGDLDEIWNWNKKTYDAHHAWRYVELLQRQLKALSEIYDQGSPVESRSGLRYMRIGKRTRGPGHIVVYRIDENAVHIARVFHTAQNWQTKLAEE